MASKKLLLEHIDVPGINTYEVYRQKGGYASVEKALNPTTGTIDALKLANQLKNKKPLIKNVIKNT